MSMEGVIEGLTGVDNHFWSLGWIGDRNNKGLVDYHSFIGTFLDFNIDKDVSGVVLVGSADTYSF